MSKVVLTPIRGAERQYKIKFLDGRTHYHGDIEIVLEAEIGLDFIAEAARKFGNSFPGDVSIVSEVPVITITTGADGIQIDQLTKLLMSDPMQDLLSEIIHLVRNVEKELNGA